MIQRPIASEAVLQLPGQRVDAATIRREVGQRRTASALGHFHGRLRRAPCFQPAATGGSRTDARLQRIGDGVFR